MFQTGRSLAVAFLFILAAAVCAQAQTPATVSGQPGLLLLRNGQVVQGKITPEGDRFYVELPSGKVWVKSVDVEVHCRTLEEGYWAKRRTMPLGNVTSHLDLAQWCLQHELPSHAANELRDALTVDPHHPRIELLERRLKLSQSFAAPPRSADVVPETAPSGDDLDRLMRELPEGAMESFTKSIQPLLVNSCTAAGCHGPAAEQAPRWVRVSAGRTSSRRLTQRNLHTALQLVNREKPLESPLLLTPTQPHGTSKTAIFNNPKSAQYRQLVAWVLQVAPAHAAPQPASVASPTSPLAQALPPSGIQRVNFESPLPAAEASNPAENTPTAPPAVRVGTHPVRSEPQRGEIPGGFRPKDAFDPEIFNRRYFPDRK